MMFSSTRLWVSIAAVATASCAWLMSDFSDRSSCEYAPPVHGALAMPTATTVLVGKAERISFDSRTNTHSFHDVPDGLYYTYSDDGFSFRPDAKQSAASKEQWQVDLSLAGVRRAEHLMSPSAKPAVSVAQTAMLIDAGSYAVEYTRTEEGMRQNFFIREQLPGDGPLTVELECKSGLDMYLAGEDDLLFVEPENSALVACYRDLHVWDAAGRVLESHMELADNTVRLVVDDADALYPVTVDPIVTAFWSSLGSQSSENQGWTVAGGRDINGDGYKDVLVGSPYYDRGGNTDIGCVRVYLGVSGGVATTASCTLYGTQANACFGWSVAFAGDVNHDGYEDIIVGAPLHDYSGATDAGKVFVYYGGSSGVSTTASWTYEANSSGMKLGTSVAGAGSVDGDNYSDIIIGAPGYSNGESGEGLAMVFCGTSTGLNSSYSWTVESNQVGAHLGASVSAAGDVNGDGYADVVVGAPEYSNGSTDEGVAFVYMGSSIGLGSSAAWTAESNQISADFGRSVACAGDVNNDGYSDVLVGAPRYDHGQTNEGKIYLYLGASGGLSATESWTEESNQNNAYMGWAVAPAGDVNHDGYDDIMTGVPYYDDGIRSDAGRVVLYGGNSAGTPTTFGTFEGENAGDMFGYTLAPAGKVNSNNLDDIIVGSPAFSSAYSDGGKASILDDPDLIYSKGGVNEKTAPVTLLGIEVYPNPSRTGGATVEFDVVESMRVGIEVLDYTGAVVYSHELGLLPVGHRSADISLSSAASGVYIVRITAGNEHTSAVMRIVR